MAAGMSAKQEDRETRKYYRDAINRSAAAGNIPAVVYFTHLLAGDPEPVALAAAKASL